jgi:long-chain fatty acid transport protein
MQGPFPLLGTHEYESFGSLVKILPAASYRVTDRLSVGGTFGVGYSYAELHGPYFLQSPGPLQGTPLLLRIHGSGATPVWSVGAQYQLTDSTMVGATYQSISSFVLRGDADVTLPSGAHTAYQSTKVDVSWPDSVGVGVKQDLGCCRTFAVDVLWFDWSQTFDRFDIGMRQPSNPLFPNINEQFPLNWKDSVSVRVGFEQKLGYDRVLRLGYVYHPDPIPDGTLTPWIQAILQDAVSVGYGFKWNCWDVNLGYMYLWGPSQFERRSDFVGLFGVGPSDFDQSHHRADIHALLLSFMRKY